MDIFGFLLQIIRDVPGLIIILGLLLFVISFVKITGKIEIVDPKDCRRCRIIGAVFLLVGILAIVYPDTVTVQGAITYENDKPAVGMRVAIGNFSTTSDENGDYELHYIPRSESFIDIIFPKYSIKERLSIPPHSIYYYNKNIKSKIINCTIEGNLNDEFGNKISNVEVWFNRNLANTSKGHYKANQIPISPTEPTFVTVKDNKGDNLPFYSEIKLSNIETMEKYKKYDIVIYLGKFVDVFGTVREYCPQNDRISEVIGAEIEIDGRLNITEENGNYLITKVPRNAVKYNVTLISGEKKTGTIKPPLSYVLPSEKTAKRNLILCKK
jgi:hypothetical protein